MDPDKTFRGSLDHRYHHDLKWQCRLLRSRVVAAELIDINMPSAQTVDIHMAFFDNMDH